MEKNMTFSKMTEDLENLSKAEKEEVEKSTDGLATGDNIVTPETDKDVEDKKNEEAKKEQEAKEEEEESTEKEADDETEEEETESEDEEVEKAEKSKDGKDKDEEKDEEGKEKKDPAKETDAKKKKRKAGKKAGEKATEEDEVEDDEDRGTKKENVKKSEDDVTDNDFVGAFQAVIKSYESVNGTQAEVLERLASLEKSFVKVADYIDSVEMESKEEVEDANEEKAKAEAEETETEETETEEVEKSEPSNIKGKSIDYIEKSEDEAEVEAEVEGEALFKSTDHVSEVVDYFMKNMNGMSQGSKIAYREAVSRVKRGEERDSDVTLFKDTLDLIKSSKK